MQKLHARVANGGVRTRVEPRLPPRRSRRGRRAGRRHRGGRGGRDAPSWRAKKCQISPPHTKFSRLRHEKRRALCWQPRCPMFCISSAMRPPSARLAATGPRVHARAASSSHGPGRGHVDNKLMPASSSGTPLQKLLRLMFTPGTGQVRAALPPNAQRWWNDIMVTSHVAFVPGIIVAAARQPPLPELALLQSCVLLLSLAYHRNYERPGLLARGEGVSAKLLFLYGFAQTCRSPYPRPSC